MAVACPRKLVPNGNFCVYGIMLSLCVHCLRVCRGSYFFSTADSNCELGEEAWLGRRGRGRKRACPPKEKWVKRREKMLSLHSEPRLEELTFPEPPKTIGGHQGSLLAFFELHQASSSAPVSSFHTILPPTKCCFVGGVRGRKSIFKTKPVGDLVRKTQTLMAFLLVVYVKDFIHWLGRISVSSAG